MSTMPEVVVTHNYDPEVAFLTNLCDLPADEAERVLQRIRDSGKRAVNVKYLGRRLETEAWLIGERQRLLGRTRRDRPIYFFLGDFADGKDPSRPCSLIMPLGVFPPDVLTFTYPDSMASFLIATRDDLRSKRRPYHGQVFTLPQIGRVVEKFGMPGERSRTDDLHRFDRFIEVQVWDERPILDFVSADCRKTERSQGSNEPD
jgi:hypothetical protein